MKPLLKPAAPTDTMIALKLSSAVERLELSVPEYDKVDVTMKERSRLAELFRRATRVLRFFRRAEHPAIADLADDIDQAMRKK